jgi:hypothetical protein
MRILQQQNEPAAAHNMKQALLAVDQRRLHTFPL